MELIELKNASSSINKVYIFNQLILILLKKAEVQEIKTMHHSVQAVHIIQIIVLCVCGQNLQACTISSSY